MEDYIHKFFKMKKIKLSISIISLILSIKSFAVVPSAEFITKLKQENEKIISMTCPFSQEKKMEILENPIFSNGQFYYEKSDKVCMNYIDPKGDLMLINGELFVMIANGKSMEKNAQNKNKFGALKNLLFACFQGDLNALGDSNLDFEEDDNYFIINVEMKKKSRILPEKLYLKYDKKDFSISYMILHESNGNSTSYELKNKKINMKLDSSVFNYNK